MSGIPCECSACKGAEVVTPAAHTNAPGLSTLAWRVGTHGQFKESMLTSIGRQSALAKLTTRADDDSTIALMDAWAASLDVLAFYQERYANENYLRTATERRSVLELARMIGYELRPGVAASTTLAYTLETAPGSPPGVQIAAGSQAMTTPGQNEAAQTFETSQALDARVAWNSFTPASWQTRQPKNGDAFVRLDGASVNVRAGDVALIVGTERLGDIGSPKVAIRRALQVNATPATPANPAYTDVVLDRPLDANTPQFAPTFYVLHQNNSLFGASALDWASLPDSTKKAYWEKAELSSDPGEWPDFSICGVSERAPPGAASAIADGTGLYGEYFTDGDFVTRYGGVVERAIDFGPGKFFGIVLPPPFSVRWTSRFSVPTDALTCVFEVTGSGHVTILVDGVECLDADLTAGAVPSNPFTLTSYRKHTLTVLYSATTATPAVTATLLIAESAVPPGAVFEAGDHGGINLDRAVSTVGPGQWVVLANARDARTYMVTAVADDGMSAFALMGKSTRVELSGTGLIDSFDPTLRSTSVFSVSEQIAFGQQPIASPLAGTTLQLTASAADLPAGRLLVVSGADPASGAMQSEVATVKSLSPDGTQIELVAALENNYARTGAVVFGNCVPATHGATIPRPEPMGAGDGSRRFQSFTLKQKPLTYTSAANAAGVATSLDVKVNDISWSEVPSLYVQPPSARVFITRRADDGTVRVTFGNGVTGARLPTGVENVVATYRTGIGAVGMAKANQVNIALTRPLGVNAVTNPAAPTGAQDPETLDGARTNAPLTVSTLDRVVSVSDYADFARGFAGASKAVSTLAWSGEKRVVFVTIASADGRPLPPDSGTYRNLVAAIDDLSPSDHRFLVVDYVPRPFRMKAAILPVPGLDFAVAAARVQAAMTAQFSFAARDLDRSLSVGELVAAMQNVDGVAAARLDELAFVVPDPVNTRPDRLLPGAVGLNGSVVLPAGLIMLAPDGLELAEMAP